MLVCQGDNGELALARRAKVHVAPITAFDISASGAILGTGSSEGACLALLSLFSLFSFLVLLFPSWARGCPKVRSLVLCLPRKLAHLFLIFLLLLIGHASLGMGSSQGVFLCRALLLRARAPSACLSCPVGVARCWEGASSARQFCKVCAVHVQHC